MLGHGGLLEAQRPLIERVPAICSQGTLRKLGQRAGDHATTGARADYDDVGIAVGSPPLGIVIGLAFVAAGFGSLRSLNTKKAVAPTPRTATDAYLAKSERRWSTISGF